MAYVELDLLDSLPKPVEAIIRIGVEPLLLDVHRMLAMSPEWDEHGPHDQQMQAPVALVLLAVVAGVSKTLLHGPEGPGHSGCRFRQCLAKFFPWEKCLAAGVSHLDASKILYDFFRNPLVHALGMNSTKSRAVRYGRLFRGTPDREQQIADLERTPFDAFEAQCLVVTQDRCDLHLDAFYWGVRQMVQRWSRDADEVSLAHSRLRKKVARPAPTSRPAEG